MDPVWGIFLNSMVEYVRHRMRRGARQECKSRCAAGEALMKIGPDLVREFTAMIVLSEVHRCSDGENIESTGTNPLSTLTRSVTESYLDVQGE